MSFLNNLEAFLDEDTDYESKRQPLVAKTNLNQNNYKSASLFKKTDSIQHEYDTEPIASRIDLNQFRLKENPVSVEQNHGVSSSNLPTNIQVYDFSNDQPEHISNESNDSITVYQQSSINNPIRRRTLGPARRVINNTNSSEDESVSTNNLFVNSSFASMIPRLKVDVLPQDSRLVFPFEEFNEMQSKSFNTIYGSNKNCVISAPTGSGKTALFELAILRANEYSDDFKVLYLAPTKALCSERKDDWTQKFSSLGITVGMLTGDSSFKEAENVRTSKIIISTPEKWDMITRKWKDYKKLFGLIKLLLVDEIHVLKESRGATLEVVMTRMKRICTGLRILAISATVANAHDIATWLDADALNFGDEYRAVKLKKLVCGFKPNSENEFSFDNFLNTKLIEVINKHSNGKPVLIFCATRNSCQQTAKYLSENYLNRGVNLKLKDKDLSSYAKLGIAFHHAGLVLADRKQIESAFLGGNIKYLCCTSTLAVGINLPAYLAVIKGTKCWLENSFQEYTETDILQMIGRAGRPQFEKDGVAIIMTNKKMEQKYERLIKGTEKVESSLHLNFPENLLAEIAVGNINSIEDATSWLKTTYFYVRLLLNPSYYDIGFNNTDESLMQLCKTHADALSEENLIQGFRCTPFGFSMIMHYIAFDTMKAIMNAGEKLSISDLLDLLGNASEFSELRIKHQEKKLFKEINKSPLMRYTSESKVKTIIQFELGGLEFPDYNGAMKLHSSFIGDRFYIFKHISRILTAIMDVFVEKKDAISLINSSFIMRSISGKGWEGSPNELRQLDGVGIAAMKKLVNHNVLSIMEAKSLTQSQIEHYMGIKVGAGAKYKKILTQIPTIELKLEEVGDSLIRVKVDISPKTTIWKNRALFLQFISSNGSKLVDFRRMSLRNVNGTIEFEVKAKSLQVEASVDIAGAVDTKKIGNLDVVETIDDNFEFDSTPEEFGMVRIDKVSTKDKDKEIKTPVDDDIKTKIMSKPVSNIGEAERKRPKAASNNNKAESKKSKSKEISGKNTDKVQLIGNKNEINTGEVKSKEHECNSKSISTKSQKIKRKTIFTSSSDSEDLFRSSKKLRTEKIESKETSRHYSIEEDRVKNKDQNKLTTFEPNSSSSEDLFKVSKKVLKDKVNIVNHLNAEKSMDLVVPTANEDLDPISFDNDIREGLSDFENIQPQKEGYLASSNHESINIQSPIQINSSPTTQVIKNILPLNEDNYDKNNLTISHDTDIDQHENEIIPDDSSNNSIFANFKAIKGPIEEIPQNDKLDEVETDESLCELQKFFGDDIIIDF
ncbi:HFM1 [Candida jiufengensis]|uniref:HFM1 n=1 Tax=Candida jiufengensis TaxID=497108 RepID=UPI00222528AF|nr:HFM1 [Candida jiufengensis]KAI5955898.1 HFM1 [Candida jiufengensis]